MANKVQVVRHVMPQTVRLGEVYAEGEKQRRDAEDNKNNNTATPDIESDSNVLEDIERGAKKPSVFKSLGWLDRYLAVWILLAIILGILLGNFAPDTAAALDRGRFVGVSVPIVEVFSHRGIWKQIGFSIFMNWIVAPFLMLALAWATLPDQPDLRAGLILVGLGRCIAMVRIDPREDNPVHPYGLLTQEKPSGVDMDGARRGGRGVLRHPRGCQLNPPNRLIRTLGGFLHPHHQPRIGATRCPLRCGSD
ncbi:hypothetical protein O1611_g10536 [Lasiodiplodia mahajangana]|uniref:Uncharacterized protein n=1 Tax=Lasiodiplodia mahajangana TaxID=1108764 RepID=A0ACC2IX55_9PEZI|nr:hypothetical protein O1611_g10536 [Lasiodiplodia mahajangana]